MAAPVRVPDRAGADERGCRGVPERGFDQLGAHVVGDGPAHDLLRKAVDDRGQVDEALPGVDVGDVADELLPKRSAVKSRRTRSGIFAAASASASVVVRNGRGWHGTRLLARMIRRTSSGEHSVPSAARSARPCAPRWPKGGGSASGRTRSGTTRASGTSSATAARPGTGSGNR